MSGRTVAARASGRWRAAWSWVGDGLVAAARGLVFFMLMLVGLAPLLALTLAAYLAIRVLRTLGGARLHGPLVTRLGLWPLLIIGSSVLGVRWLAGLTRQLAGRWCGTPIAAPYRPLPAGQHISVWWWLRRRLEWLLSDPATWRDLLWLAVDACAGWVLAAGPACLILYGLADAVVPALGLGNAHSPFNIILAKGSGAPLVAGLWAGPSMLTAYGGLARTMLAPTRRTELTVQVQHLARTRSDFIDTGAAQIRQIERDLHDGAQARLVAMGMTLDAAEQVLDDNPAAARALLAEARASSAKALAELRDLVRGIHPPVLADRGLADAVRALTLDAPVRVHLTAELPGRPPAPVESGAYFAVSELLANVSKHAEADQAWIDIRHDSGMLRIGVTDDGRGGADQAGGTGLRGIERRLASFDGVLAVTSPPGGPTVVNMEIPCALSSPKTSSC